jgi:hypothetical protein
MFVLFWWWHVAADDSGQEFGDPHTFEGSVAELPASSVTPRQFWSEFAEKWKPLLLKGAVSDSPALRWNQTYLRKYFGYVPVHVHANREAASGDPLFSLGVQNKQPHFIDTFFNHSKHLRVWSSSPSPLNWDVLLPACIMCGQAPKNDVASIAMQNHWSGDRSSNTASTNMKGPSAWMTPLSETGKSCSIPMIAVFPIYQSICVPSLQ